MVDLTSLIVPIVVSAIIVFVASSVMHMVLPYHKGDFASVPKADEVQAALRPFNIAPGDYFLPRPASMGDMKTPEFQEKMKKGPVIVMTVMPNGQGSMARNLAMWFVYIIVVSFFSAYIAGRALATGANYLHVFRFVGFDLVPQEVEHDDQVRVRWSRVRAAHGGHVRVAVAEMKT
jgi:hypothetical protein